MSGILSMYAMVAANLYIISPIANKFVKNK